MLDNLDRIMVNPGIGEVKVYFDPKLFLVNREELENRSTASVLAGKANGFNLDLVDYGAIDCLYNPLTTQITRAFEVTKELVSYIQSCRLAES